MLSPSIRRRVVIAALTVTVLSAVTAALHACTRCAYLGTSNNVLVARSMDWAEDPGTNLYVLPRGMKRDGATGPTSMTWTSKYGSVICSFYEVAAVDGINEKGLVANVLYLVESDYGKPREGKKTISIAAWCQYVLDNFATVKEVVDALKDEPFTIIAPVLPNNKPAQGHLAVSDPTGDSAIFEYVKGKLVIHHGRQYQVMTNSPTFDQQLALTEYWEQIGGLTMLPGTIRAADRFVRTSFYIKALPRIDDVRKSIPAVFSVIRSASVPLGISVPGKPDIASTIWRTLYNQKDRVMYFESTLSPTVFAVPLDDLNFREGSPVKKLPLSGGETYSGNAASKFVDAELFKFLPGKVD